MELTEIFKETEMLNRFFKVVHKASVGSDFEHYFSSVSQKNGSYPPTLDEAKKDYRSAIRARF